MNGGAAQGFITTPTFPNELQGGCGSYGPYSYPRKFHYAIFKMLTQLLYFIMTKENVENFDFKILRDYTALY